MTEVSTARQLSEVQRVDPVVFLLVHDGQRDPDWHQTYSQVAQEKGLMAKFGYTTKVDLVQVDLSSVRCVMCGSQPPLFSLSPIGNRISTLPNFQH